MADPHEEFGWLAGYGPFYAISCVSFVRSLPPIEALTRLGAGAETLEEVTFEKLQERTMACLDSDPMRSYVGVVELGGWTALIELWTASMMGYQPMLGRLSRATEVVLINRNIHATDYFVHAIDGVTLTWFDLLVPQVRTGSDPDRLINAMKEVGLNPDHGWDDPVLEATFPRSFALARTITGLPFSENVLDMRFLSAVIDNG
ncbi:DUF6461 domain-containing protein [Nonomuraea sp. NPDC005983]|uniref:DUF6461 domain-containing protein n=1 Tax=Nonomuraea sp. NPDC005983 TaxID=3155595 RepID=UPI0033BA1100